MAKEKGIDVHFDGPTLEQIEEIERLSGKPILAILRESVHRAHWIYKELTNGAQLWIGGPDPDGPKCEVVFK
jgi:hypothetical protein